MLYFFVSGSLSDDWRGKFQKEWGPTCGFKKSALKQVSRWRHQNCSVGKRKHSTENEKTWINLITLKANLHKFQTTHNSFFPRAPFAFPTLLSSIRVVSALESLKRNLCAELKTFWLRYLNIRSINFYGAIDCWAGARLDMLDELRIIRL